MPAATTGCRCTSRSAGRCSTCGTAACARGSRRCTAASSRTSTQPTRASPRSRSSRSNSRCVGLFLAYSSVCSSEKARGGSFVWPLGVLANAAPQPADHLPEPGLLPHARLRALLAPAVHLVPGSSSRRTHPFFLSSFALVAPSRLSSLSLTTLCNMLYRNERLRRAEPERARARRDRELKATLSSSRLLTTSVEGSVGQERARLRARTRASPCPHAGEGARAGHYKASLGRISNAASVRTRLGVAPQPKPVQTVRVKPTFPNPISLPRPRADDDCASHRPPRCSPRSGHTR